MLCTMLFSTAVPAVVGLAVLQNALPVLHPTRAIIIPGFLTGSRDFEGMAAALRARGVDALVLPLPAWAWVPCLGGRSMRPVLERIEHAVRHACALETLQEGVPAIEYGPADLWHDFWTNPGGVRAVGGSAEPDEYPLVEPRGRYPPAGPPRGTVALVGHSAGGWIARLFLSSRSYGGKSYCGAALVHSLVTLGTPHGEGSGPAFRGVAWARREPVPVRALAVGADGTPGGSSGAFTKNAYAFCTQDGDGAKLDGDGVTPISSALDLDGAERLVIPGACHFDFARLGLIVPELAAACREGKQWYGSDSVVADWAPWLHQVD
jgi:hypothetical protein